MKIFNLRFICKEATPEEGISELNTYSLGDAADVGINGLVYGVEFFVNCCNSYELFSEGSKNRVFFLVQCEDEHQIFFVPEEATSREDYILIFSHNTYEDKFDVVNQFASFSEEVFLKDLWLYSIDNSPKYKANTFRGFSK